MKDHIYVKFKSLFPAGPSLNVPRSWMLYIINADSDKKKKKKKENAIVR